MKKTEFLKAIKDIDTRYFTCGQIEDNFGKKARKLYSKLCFGDSIHTHIIEDLCYTNKTLPEKVEKGIRIILLEQFKRIALDTDIYTEFKGKRNDR